jgi:glutathione S-transferase
MFVSFLPSVNFFENREDGGYLQLVGDERRDSILGPREKIGAWMENVKKATSPHFEEAHELIFKMKARLSANRVKTVSKL